MHQLLLHKGISCLKASAVTAPRHQILLAKGTRYYWPKAPAATAQARSFYCPKASAATAPRHYLLLPQGISCNWPKASDTTSPRHQLPLLKPSAATAPKQLRWTIQAKFPVKHLWCAAVWCQWAFHKQFGWLWNSTLPSYIPIIMIGAKFC